MTTSRSRLAYILITSLLVFITVAGVLVLAIRMSPVTLCPYGGPCISYLIIEESPELSGLFGWPWIVPIGSALISAAWLANLAMHIRRLERENTRLRDMLVQKGGA